MTAVGSQWSMDEWFNDVRSPNVRRLKGVSLVSEKSRGQWVFYRVNKVTEQFQFIEPLLEQLPNVEDKIAYFEEKGLKVICETNSKATEEMKAEIKA